MRAYVTSIKGTFYSDTVSFPATADVTGITESPSDTILVVSQTATLTTTAVTNVTTTGATSGGNVTADGGFAVTARGVCWNTTGNPTITDSHTTDGSGTGTFTSNITGLTAGTTYYVRAYAINSAGAAYGSTVSFTTEAASAIPPQ
jgi:hypothetical protein